MNRHLRMTATAVLLASMWLGGAGCAVGLRVYDPGYGDYHVWDRHEESVFRIYLSGRHESYRQFRSLDRDQQREYWKWRHEQPDADRR
jgi:hypothetical protein